MSSEFQSSGIQSVGLSSNSGVCVIHPAIAVSEPTEVHGISAPLRFNSLTLNELCKELDRRTKETLKLQEEVENATKVTLEKFGHVYDNNSSDRPGNHRSNVCNALGDSVHHQVVTQLLGCGLDSLHQETTQTNVCSPEKEALQNAGDDCLQQFSEFQASDQHEQETYRFEEAILKLQTELQKVQMEKDILSDLRLKDSREHVHQMEKMLCLLEELQVTKRSGEQRLQKTEDEALVLNKKVETLEKILKDYYAEFSREKQSEHNGVNSLNTDTVPRHLSTSAGHHNDEGDKIHKKNILQKEHLVEECIGVNKQERMENLIASLGQEMAMLTEKLSSTKTNSVGLSVKLELLKKLAERQIILHQDQVSELESTISSQKDKVGCLEQQLTHVQSQLVDAKRKEERLQNHIQELQSQVSQVKRCKQQQCELQEEVKALRGQLEEAQEQLCRAGEEKTCLQALLEERAQEGRKSQELLEEKKVELQLRQQEAQQHVACLDEARSQCHKLHAERDTLCMQLNDGEKMIEILRLQLESSSQMTAQHVHTIDSLHRENSLLSNQLNQHKLEILQLTAEIDQHKSSLATAEHERHRLQVSVAEQTHRIQEETLEKRQLTTQLEVQRLQLLTLTKEHKELQRLHSCKDDEHKGVVLKLQSHLKNLQGELDRVRSTLRTLEGADGHGFEVALGMQKEITARRKQIDFLQGRIQHLEETTDRLSQEKLYQKLENQHQLDELTSLREEKKQLSTALEALHSKDKQLKERISELKAILHQLSESFASCQDFIQMQEQAFYRLKLKHTLDLKERQGRTLCTPPAPVSPSALTAPPFSQHASDPLIKSKTQEHCPSMELRSLVKDLRGVISENQRPHTNNISNTTTDSSNTHRRRSAPERARRATLSTGKTEGEVMAGSRLRRKTYGSEPQLLKTADMNGKLSQNNSFSQNPLTSTPTGAPWYVTSSQLLSLGRRSPVHSLLTSDPNS
ncbi:coiled-coil domain-containing protein 158-like isoform X3 [Sphaeramia orbicularis]|uniref:coiled-coil domain-containing protein 158-like isoform X3 n=1 Tax=Sphaeramia orbicularis TaxID=375764 RepID=UPI00117E0D9F|nr:coiled-coil domain-containing protein 158-like isoform X3 [Sphaeramia orbicularis]